MTPLVVDPSAYLKPHHSVGHCLWLAPWIQLFALSLLYHAHQSCRAWIWRRRDNQGRHSEGAWRGGTLDCLFLGSLTRRGKLLTPSDWDRYWGNRQPASDAPSLAQNASLDER